VGRLVRVLDDPVRGDDEHTLLERVEDLLEEGAFLREPLDEVRQVDGIEAVQPPQHAVERGVFLS
jgi:hypothetical protein